jgi:magnesium transporter
MTEHQRSKVDDYDDYCFIVLHFPRFKKQLKRLAVEEIDIFLGPDYLITLHEGELKPMINLVVDFERDEGFRTEHMGNGPALLLYEITKSLFDYCFPMLDKIGDNLDEINKEIFRKVTRNTLESIAGAKMQIINYRRIMKPMRPVILTLEKVIRKYMPEDMDVYFDDITDKAEKIWDMLENYKEVIESLESTFTSLTNHRINNLMRMFTVIQVIILPMVLVSGLFSMNVQGIPFHNIGSAFWIVFGMIFIPMMTIALIMFIKRKKWL